MVKSNIPHRVVNTTKNSMIEHICIKFENNVHIIAAYNRPINKFSRIDINNLMNVGDKVILVGDLNA